jgi:hypothetical protein
MGCSILGSRVKTSGAVLGEEGGGGVGPCGAADMAAMRAKMQVNNKRVRNFIFFPGGDGIFSEMLSKSTQKSITGGENS